MTGVPGVALSATGVRVLGGPMTLDVIPPGGDTVLLPAGLRRSAECSDVDTLAELLVRLGHHCRGECPDEPFHWMG